jgi:hypothetical protein
MTLVRLGLLSLVALAVAVPSAVAARPRLAVTPAVTTPGARVHIDGVAPGCPAGSTVIAISSAFPGHAYGNGTLEGRVGSGGAFAYTGRLRSRLRAGRYAVTARCGGGNLGIVVRLDVR